MEDSLGHLHHVRLPYMGEIAPLVCFIPQSPFGYRTCNTYIASDILPWARLTTSLKAKYHLLILIQS